MANNLRLGSVLASVALWACLCPGAIEEDLSLKFHNSTEVEVEYKRKQALSDFPLLVRISASRIPSYEPALAGLHGENLRFAYAEFDTVGLTNVVYEIVPCEVDTWNPGGESLVWVKYPKMTRKDGIHRLFMYWNPREDVEIPANDPSAVWKNYAGVWHLNDETSAASHAAESAFGERTALRDDGAIGSAIASKGVATNDYLMAVKSAAVDSLTNGGFTASMWLNFNDLPTNNILQVLTRQGSENAMGWGIALTNSADSLWMVPGSKAWPTNAADGLEVNGLVGERGLAAGSWHKFDFAFSNGCLAAYFDGARIASGTNEAWTLDNGPEELLALGGYSTTNCFWEVVTDKIANIIVIQESSIKTNYYPGVVGPPFKFEDIESITTNYIDVVRTNYSERVSTNFWARGKCGLLNAAADEFRLQFGLPTSTNMVWAEYAQVADTNFVKFVRARYDGLLVNSWKALPTMSKTVWRAGERGATVYVGRAVGGYSEVTYRNLVNGIIYTQLPTAKGNYRAEFYVNGSDVGEGAEPYTDLTYCIDFTIEAGITTPPIAGVGDFARHATFTVTATDIGELKDFPFLVQLKKDSPKGFSYDDLAFGSATKEDAYSQLRFFDGDGQPLDYEIDEWHPDGTSIPSILWVKVPLFRKDTTITLCWNIGAGVPMPSNDPLAVWSDYLSVLHFSETITSNAGTVVSHDSSGNGRDGVPVSGNNKTPNLVAMKSTAGVIGNGRQNETRNLCGGNALEIRGSDTLMLGETFTISGFFKRGSEHKDDHGTVHSPVLFSRRGATETEGGFRVWYYKDWEKLSVSGGGTNTITTTKIFHSTDSGDWRQTAVIYDGGDDGIYGDGRSTVYGVKYKDGAETWQVSSSSSSADDFAASENGKPLRFGDDAESGTANYTFNGQFDELRIRPGKISKGWFTAEHYQVRETGKLYKSAAVEKVEITVQNRWKRLPSLSAQVWTVGDEPASVDLGETFGSNAGDANIVVTYYDRRTGEAYEDMPKKAGEYRAVFAFRQTDKWSEISAEVNFQILRPDDVPPQLACGSDRVLLANDDLSFAGAEVSFQSYDDNVEGWGLPYWRHMDENGDIDDSNDDYLSFSPFFNIFRGTHHEYLSAEGERLWGLIHVRFGNTFPNAWNYPGQRGAEGLSPDQNYLPWNPSSMRMLGYLGYEVGQFHEYAGQLLMRNVEGAAIHSSCYKDGIGTVYFDAVNGWTDNVTNEDGTACYVLRLQVATNIDNSAEAPYDGKLSSPNIGWNPYNGADWHDVEMGVVRLVEGDVKERFTARSLELKATTGGRLDDFYRVYAKVDVAVPARFRIVRERIDQRYRFDPDAGALILIDNVICSKPADRVLLAPYGIYDPSRTYKQLLGREGAFEIPFPGAGDVVKPRAKCVNRDGDEVPPSLVTAAAVHYRWRYLQQRFNDWRTVELDPQTLKGRSTFALPGAPGDVEFWFECSQNGGYYRYVDYSGADLGVPGYSEAVLSTTNGYDGVTADWFFRLREGFSDTEGYDLVVREPIPWYRGGGFKEVRRYPMELYAGTRWRAYYPTPEDMSEVTGVYFRVERQNEQTQGATKFAYNTNSLYSADEVLEMPFATQLFEGGTNDWLLVPVDAQTGYLLFQLDDATRGLTIVHADYQNFNDWHDAAGKVFVGTSADTNDVRMSGSGGSTREIKGNFKDRPNSESTNEGYWNDNFNMRAGSTRDINEMFLKTTNIWNLGKGCYVCAYYDDYEITDRVEGEHLHDWEYAYKMSGQGEGYLELIDPGVKPRGVESVEFCARVAQDVDFDAFAVYDGEDVTGGNPSKMRQYTFRTLAAFDLEENKGFTGNASLSLCAFYRPGRGCYEARFEQIRGIYSPGNAKDAKPSVYGPGVTNAVRLVLNRWNSRPEGGYDITTLYCVTNNMNVPYKDRERPPTPSRTDWFLDNMPQSTPTRLNLMGFFITAYTNSYGDACILAGVSPKGMNGNVYEPGSPDKRFNGAHWYCVGCIDTNDNRLVSGTFGMQAANCDGRFYRPTASKEPITFEKTFEKMQVAWVSGEPTTEDTLKDYYIMSFVNDTTKKVDGWFKRTWSRLERGDAAQFGPNPFYQYGMDDEKQRRTVNFPDMRDLSISVPGGIAINEDDWIFHPARIEAMDTDNAPGYFGFQAAPPSQEVQIWLADISESSEGNWSVNESAWQLAAVCSVTNFGPIAFDPEKLSRTWGSRRFNFYLTDNKAVRLRSGGSLGDKFSNSIVIDNVVLRQWRGEFEDYSGKQHDAITGTSAWFKNGKLQLSAKRTRKGPADGASTDDPCSVRGPLFDGENGRGLGVGFVGVTYSNIQFADWLGDVPFLLVQVADGVSDRNFGSLSQWVDRKYDTWTNVAEYTVSDLKKGMDAKGTGTLEVHVSGFRGKPTMARVIVNPYITDALYNSQLPAATNTHCFCSIDIEEVSFKDEPSLDRGCWWGWNMRTLGDNLDTERRMYLPDARIPVTPGSGLSLALNNSTTMDIDTDVVAMDKTAYEKNKPFVQSPSLTNAVVGEITFKARKYDGSPSSQPAELRLYGADRDTLDHNRMWKELDHFVISNTVFETFSHSCTQGETYCAFRLAVTGVDTVTGGEPPQNWEEYYRETYNPAPTCGEKPVRVLLDEIVVSEAIKAKMGFRNVGAFRNYDYLTGVNNGEVPNVPSRSEQPLVGEAWGVQAEIYAMTMAEDVDLTREPRVCLHWYVGEYPWGYRNWKDLPDAHSGWMSRAETAEPNRMVYRSSYIDSPAAVVSMSRSAPTIVQYILEVEYYVKDKDGRTSRTTAWLSPMGGDWRRPEWYAPLNFNADPNYGAGIAKDAVAYCVLETVSPGWAWINEVNIISEYSEQSRWLNSDEYCQYIEIAAPNDADMTGWKVQMLTEGGVYTDVTTNTLATFGSPINGLQGTKDKGWARNMSFFVIANNEALVRGNLSRDEGSFDGSWQADDAPSSVMNHESLVISSTYPFGLRLVSPAGIVYSEIVTCGTNLLGSILSNYSMDRIANVFNQYGGKNFFNAGSDNGGVSNSLSKIESSIEKDDEPANWHNNIEKTPGRINIGQEDHIPENHPTPNGESVIIYASIDNEVGHLRQFVGGLEEPTNTTQILAVKRDDEGTNIVYYADPWYELGSVTENGVETESEFVPVPGQKRAWSVTVGVGAEKSINVKATARVEKSLRDLGADENNVYTPALVDWLTKGETKKGPFENPEGGIALAGFRPYGNPHVVTNLTLTQMYWLDIDPTASNFVFEAGFVDINQKPIPITNRTDYTEMRIFMMITNETENTKSKYYQKCWSPYMLRGQGFEETSQEYENDSPWVWTNETFQVCGLLVNGQTSIDNKSNWLPLRWFVFHEDSFYQEDEYDDGALVNKRFTTRISIPDPLTSPKSPAWGAGWHDWYMKNGEIRVPIYFGWQIDSTFLPFSAKVLLQENDAD